MSARITVAAALAAVQSAGGVAAIGEEKIARAGAIALVPVVEIYVIRDDAYGLKAQRTWLGSAEIVGGTVDPAAVSAALAGQPEAARLVLV